MYCWVREFLYNSRVIIEEIKKYFLANEESAIRQLEVRILRHRHDFSLQKERHLGD